MKRWLWLSLLVVLVVVQVLMAKLPAEAQQGESVGKVTALEGRATVQHNGGSAPQAVRLQGPVYQQDVVRTEAASKLQLTFVDGTVVSLGEQSTLQITRFVYSPPKQTQNALVTISVGVFRAIVKTLSPESTFEINTPTAIAAIRGTDIMGEVGGDATAIVVLDGTVALFNAQTVFRGIVALTPGLGSTVRNDRPPTPPTKWAEERIELLQRATTIR
jgi:hypothetical protein